MGSTYGKFDGKPIDLSNFNKDLSEISWDNNGMPKIKFHSDMRAGPITTTPNTDANNDNNGLLGINRDTWTGVARLLGQVGQAFSAREPSSWQHALGKSVEETAAGRQEEALRRGRTLTGMGAFGITPQERSKLAAEALGEKKFGLSERGAGQTDERLRLLEKELGVRENIAKGRNLTDIDVAKIRALGSAAGANKKSPWIQWGYDQMLNLNTGEVKNVHAKPETPVRPIPETTRANIDSIFKQIRNEAPSERELGHGGLRGKIDPPDLDKMILENNIPGSMRSNPRLMDLINTYAHLKFGSDILKTFEGMGVAPIETTKPKVIP